jgi:membrane protein implicated in regulation of membrane protease activity
VGVLGDLYLTHPAWAWAAAAAVLLAAELMTGSGWLLWPAAAAGVVALLSAAAGVPTSVAVLLFAALTVAATLTARRLFPRRPPKPAPDLNDQRARLIGHDGRVVGAFEAGAGRVLVDGKEWPAELEGGAPPPPGGRVLVTGVAGVRLKVVGL